MNKIKLILKEQFGIEYIYITEIHGGLSTMNYKVMAAGQSFFLKVYDKKKAQSSLWTENINCYMPILVWLNENTDLQGRIVRPLKTKEGKFRYDDNENVFLLFDYIEGNTVGKSLTHSQLIEAAEIMACLHNYSSEIPVIAANAESVRRYIKDKMQEDFSISFCNSLERFIAENYSTAPADVKAILRPCLANLCYKNNEVKLLAEKVKKKNINMVLCHTDAHGYNLMQSKHLVLVDWEGIKLAPAEADLIMFSKRAYWEIFIVHYMKNRPGFFLDNDIFMFYILRRKIEDIWAFIESILFDNLSVEQRESDIMHLSNCCNSLDELYFEL